MRLHRLIKRELYMSLSPALKSASKKYIVVTGGVISGIGKGVTASSIGVLCKMLALKPTAVKIDPYLNVDAGTMSPLEHGETFVLDDGAETDLDLGNYERFLDVKLSCDSNLTTGKIYQAVIAKERRGEYLGRTVQIIPHITNEIMERIVAVSKQPVGVDDGMVEPDVCVIEMGGTVGDIESMPFVEAVRQLQLAVGPENVCIVHVSMVPTVGGGEQKTKPTQHSVKELRGLGLAPDVIVCRAQAHVTKASRAKIALFCNVPEENVLSIHDVPNIYHVPLLMIEQNLPMVLCRRLGLFPDRIPPLSLRPSGSLSAFNSLEALSDALYENLEDSARPTITADESFISKWREMVERADTVLLKNKGMDGVGCKESSSADVLEAPIALIGKYTSQMDSYLSICSALEHSAVATMQRLRLITIDSEDLDGETAVTHADKHAAAWRRLREAKGVIVPGGFGLRGMEGKIAAIKYAREHQVPFLGICLGMQAAVIEFTRSVLHRPLASSEEFAVALSPEDAAVVFMPEGSRDVMGGTMRLGSRETFVAPDTTAMALYQSGSVHERHRHRYEVNPSLVPLLEERGLVFSGRDDTGMRMEIVELRSSEHPYFVATQFHPEFKSRPLRPAPVFLGLLNAIKALASSTQ